MVQKKNKTKTKKKIVKKTATTSLKKQTKKIHSYQEYITHYLKRMNEYLTLVAVVIISGLLFFLVGWHLVSKSYYVKKLPLDTVQFVNINLKKFSHQSFLQDFLNITGFSFDKDFLPEIQKKQISYITFFKNKENTNGFFLEKLSQKSSVNLLQEMGNIENIENLKKSLPTKIVFNKGSEFFCQYQRFTLYCAEKIGVLNFKDQKKKYTQIINFKKNLNNLPRSSDVFWFLDTQFLNKPFLKIHQDIVGSFYGSFFKKWQDIEASLYIPVNQKFFSEKKELFKMNNLLQKFSKENLLLFFSGYNFKDKWLHTEDFYQKYSPEYLEVIKGLLSFRVKKYFGNDIDFYQDILALLENYYALALTKDEENQVHLNFVTETKNREKVKQLLSEFIKNRGLFVADTQEVVIDEKTTLKKIYANENQVTRVNERFGAARIYGYEIKDQPWGLFTAQLGNIIYISTSKQELKRFFDGKKENNLAQIFGKNIINANEFGWVSLAQLQEVFAHLPLDLVQLNKFDKLRNFHWEAKSFPGGVRVVGDIDYEE